MKSSIIFDSQSISLYQNRKSCEIGGGGERKNGGVGCGPMERWNIEFCVHFT